MDLIITVLPVVTKDLPISPRFTPYNVLSRCKFSTLTTRQPMVGFYLLTFSRFPLRKKEHKSYFGKNRTHYFRTSRCAGYLLDPSGDMPPFKRGHGRPALQTLRSTALGLTSIRRLSCLKKNQNAPRPSEHPPVRGKKMSKHLGGIVGCKYNTSSWHFNGFPYGSNIGSTV